MLYSQQMHFVSSRGWLDGCSRMHGGPRSGDVLNLRHLDEQLMTQQFDSAMGRSIIAQQAAHDRESHEGRSSNCLSTSTRRIPNTQLLSTSAMQKIVQTQRLTLLPQNYVQT